MGAGADILARLDEIERKLDRALVQPGRRGGKGGLEREVSSREQLERRQAWAAEHVAELDRSDAVLCIGELVGRGVPVTPEAVRQLVAVWRTLTRV